MASFNEPEWQVRAASPHCEGCGKAFADGESLTSRLSMEPGAGYMRRDLCSACAPQAPGEAVSAWRTVYHQPPPVEEPLKKETAESLLRHLIESKDDTKLSAIFVLAVMLERKRLLIERDVQILENGHRRRIYEHRGTGETFVIVDPRLRLDDLEAVQTEVVALLGGGAASPAATGGEAAPGTAPAGVPADPPGTPPAAD
ncbi:MAG: hypothetical protein FJ221_10915 [Lentisphaerae bacterium]|nr:hypothetical protein [Lentisphaerota bacterium]